MPPNSLDWLIAGLISYLVGSTPTAYLAARWLKGEDLRRLGDRNLGAANVYRNIGSRAGIAVGIIDIAKGSAAVLLAQALFNSTAAEMIAGVAAVAGHNWPVHFRLRGGRGAATGVGVLIAVLPALALPLGITGLCILWLTRKAIMSLAFFLITVPVLTWWLAKYPYPVAAWWPVQYSYEVAAFALGIPILVGVSHFLSVRRDSAPDAGSEPALPQG